MTELTISTNLAVLGVAQNITPEGGHEMSAGAIARVETAVAYYKQHEDVFTESLRQGTGGIIGMLGGFAALASAGHIEAPPYIQREGTQMYNLALDMGVPPRHLANSPRSTSTLENLLCAQEEGHFTAAGPGNPLGIVTEATVKENGDPQFSQFYRAQWLAMKIYDLPLRAIVHIPTATEISAAQEADERNLFTITKLLYGPARTPAGLRRAERIAGLGSRIVAKTGLRRPPTENYANVTG